MRCGFCGRVHRRAGRLVRTCCRHRRRCILCRRRLSHPGARHRLQGRLAAAAEVVAGAVTTRSGFLGIMRFVLLLDDEEEEEEDDEDVEDEEDDDEEA